jgi:hypothetical protein
LDGLVKLSTVAFHGDCSDVDRVLRLQTCRSRWIFVFAMDADVCVPRTASPPAHRRPNEPHLLSGLLQAASGIVDASAKDRSRAPDAARRIVLLEVAASDLYLVRIHSHIDSWLIGRHARSRESVSRHLGHTRISAQQLSAAWRWVVCGNGESLTRRCVGMLGRCRPCRPCEHTVEGGEHDQRQQGRTDESPDDDDG